MNLHLAKKLMDKLKINPKTLKETPPTNELFSWRANYVQEHGYHFLVFMNDASRLTIVLNEAKAAKLKNLSEHFIKTLRATLLVHGINPEVIEKYISDLGEIVYVKNTNPQKTAWLNKCVNEVWYRLRDLENDVELSVSANSVLHGTSSSDKDCYTPKERFMELLKTYGLPVRKFQAYDLNVRLSLFGYADDAVRRLRVPANISFNKLHRLLQIAFGWNNCHLHSFGLFKEWNENPYATPDIDLQMDEYALEYNPNAQLTAGKFLSDFVPQYMKIMYRYDFGDDWQHYIEIENIIEDCDEELPILLSGEGDAPPEDVGGCGGYAEFLEIIADPEHEEYEHMKSWSKSQGWRRFDFDWVARIIKLQH